MTNETQNFINGKINYFTDPGHGWLEVPITVLKELKIYNLITHFSYKKGGMAYLEEDCDMGLFLQTVKRLFNIDCKQLNIVDINTNNSSVIRNYRSY